MPDQDKAASAAEEKALAEERKRMREKAAAEAIAKGRERKEAADELAAALRLIGAAAGDVEQAIKRARAAGLEDTTLRELGERVAQHAGAITHWCRKGQHVLEGDPLEVG